MFDSLTWTDLLGAVMELGQNFPSVFGSESDLVLERVVVHETERRVDPGDGDKVVAVKKMRDPSTTTPTRQGQVHKTVFARTSSPSLAGSKSLKCVMNESCSSPARTQGPTEGRAHSRTPARTPGAPPVRNDASRRRAEEDDGLMTVYNL